MNLMKFIFFVEIKKHNQYLIMKESETKVFLFENCLENLNQT